MRIRILGALLALGFAAAAPAGRADDGGRDSILRWVNEARLILEGAKRDAIRKRAEYRFNDAQRILVSGLERASALPSIDRSESLVAKAVRQGKVLAQAIRDEQGQGSRTDRILTYFLLRYYEFTLTTATQLDIPYYVPYHRARRVPQELSADFEMKFVVYAREQVELVLETLAECHDRQVNPIGEPESYLVALEKAAASSAEEIRESILAHRYAEEIYRLRDLAGRIAAFRSGGTDAYSDIYRAVQDTYEEAHEAIGGLRHAHLPSEREPRAERIASSFTLSYGETRSIDLRGFERSFVQKLYVQAYGVGRDATFEVIVNGDVKGTIYVPGDDPSYVVTVADYADSIELRHVSGARVQILGVTAVLR